MIMGGDHDHLYKYRLWKTVVPVLDTGPLQPDGLNYWRLSLQQIVTEEKSSTAEPKKIACLDFTTPVSVINQV